MVLPADLTVELDAADWLALHPGETAYAVTLQPGEQTALVNNCPVELRGTPFVEKDVFYYPLEDIVELFGDTFRLDGDQVTVDTGEDGSFSFQIGSTAVTAEDGTIYAKLREKLETPYGPIRECRSNGDAVLPVVQTGENQWQISFDLVDYNTELLPVIGTGTLELTINPLGELYGEIPQTSGYVLKMGNTKLYAAEEWLNGQYQAYDEENSVLVIPADEEIVDVFECEELLRRYVYGPWVDETLSAAGTIMLESGDWIVTRSGGSLYRNYYYSFSFQDIQEPGVLHTIEVYPDAELYLDGKAYTRTY